MNKKYWALVMDNFEGQDDILYFKNYEIARENFEVICEKLSKNKEFFRWHDSYCEWFDPRYNEYSTYVFLCERELTIHDKIIFQVLTE